MNTKSVADLLGISTRTVQRWVKQLGLEMARNDLGHFIFTEEDIELLKQVKKQLEDGVLLQDITVKANNRTGVVRSVQTEMQQTDLEEIEEKIKNLELSLYQKADSVVSYQLLQHRREIEELQNQITNLKEQISNLEKLLIREVQTAASLEETKIKPRKKKSFLKGIFGF
ncbi:MerR family transcriptional regulator [Niallia sp. XMNu-256]|uniref:MerR family transcriptional regulator n=1 Tax=Niallia sp. XMNu-256 TaxID=3082444 RepID=UPI0030D21E21